MKKYLFLSIIFVFIPILSACSNSTTESTEADNGPLTVYTTVFPLKSFTEQIGKDAVTVETIYPNGADIHTYEPTQKDMLEYAEGDLFIYTTDALDPVSEKIRGAVEDHTAFFPAAENISEAAFEHDHTHENEEGHNSGHADDDTHEHNNEDADNDAHRHNNEDTDDDAHRHNNEDVDDDTHRHNNEDTDDDAHGHNNEDTDDDAHGHNNEGDDAHGHSHGTDPHIWLDPNLSIEMAEAIKDKLVEMDPDNESTYTENFESLKEELATLHTKLGTITEDPARDTVYISHESIGYLADRYHFEQVGISGLNNQDPSQQELTQIIEDIEAEEIPYILYEQNITSKVTDTIREETGTEPLEFHNLAVLNDEDDPEATYQSIMQENIEVLDRALNE